jgi:hypothetical protein
MLLIERWFNGGVWLRIVSLIATGAGVALVAWLCLIRPQSSLLQQLQNGNERTSQQLADVRRKIGKLTALNTPLEPSNDPFFSVAEFVGQAQGKLLKWQPDEKQGTLEMLLPWEKLPESFSRLAEYRVVAGHSFTITAQGELLKLVLAMEFADEP